MKKIVSIVIALAIFIITIVSALADVSVTYNFDQNNVDAQAYACLDSDCSSVAAFAGQLQSSTNTGQLTLVYPAQLQTQYGYAVYFTSPGFVPKEDGGITLAGSGTIVRSDVLSFSQVAECKTTIDYFEVIDVSMPYMPITINVNTLLDAWTYSAFKSLNTGVEYVPPSLLDYYSADTLVTLTIHDQGGILVEQQFLPLSIFVDSSEHVSFTWTPSSQGEHTAKVEVVVTDDQCSSYGAPQYSLKEFTVLPELPMNSCYTLLNDLAPVSLNPKVGDTVNMGFNKISNHASNDDPYGPDYVLTPLDTQINYKVYAPGGSLVTDQTQTFASNAIFSIAEYLTFAFDALFEGTYTVEVIGKAADSLCSGLDNFQDLVQTTFFVDTTSGGGVSKYDVTFNVKDTNGAPIEGVQVVFHGMVSFTDASGNLVFGDVAQGTYAYLVSKSGFQGMSSSLFVDDDLTVNVVLSANGGVGGNPAPETPNAGDLAQTNERFGLHVSSIRVPEVFRALPGTSLPLYLYFENDGELDIEDLKVAVVIQELAARASVGPFDLHDGKSAAKTLLLDLPFGAEPGVYHMRLTLESEDIKRVIYREIELRGPESI